VVSDQAAAQNNIEGVIIASVVPGGPAEQAGVTGVKQNRNGIQVGDVIVGIEGVEVHRSSELYKVLDSHKVGDEVEVTLDNQGHRRTVKIKLQAAVQ
jgi:S1-C subfamily serine protease